MNEQAKISPAAPAATVAEGICRGDSCSSSFIFFSLINVENSHWKIYILNLIFSTIINQWDHNWQTWWIFIKVSMVIFMVVFITLVLLDSLLTHRDVRSQTESPQNYNALAFHRLVDTSFCSTCVFYGLTSCESFYLLIVWKPILLLVHIIVQQCPAGLTCHSKKYFNLRK